jgi:hypothetical protein
MKRNIMGKSHDYDHVHRAYTWSIEGNGLKKTK